MRIMKKSYSLYQASILTSLLAVSCMAGTSFGQMGGMGGMGGGMGSQVPFVPPTGPLVTWSKPQGEPPQWLITGNNALQANELVRRNLERQSECEFVQTPLDQAVLAILDAAKVPYALNAVELESAGRSPDSPVSLTGKGPTRELLRRILSSLDLGYIVREDHIEITSEDDMRSRPVLRTYDLAHVMPDNRGLNELLTCIQSTIAPDYWESGDSVLSPLGSLLVVRATEDVHHEISKLLVIRSLAPQSQPQAGGMLPGMMTPGAGGSGAGGSGAEGMKAMPGLPPPNSLPITIEPNATSTTGGSPQTNPSPSSIPPASLGSEGSGSGGSGSEGSGSEGSGNDPFAPPKKS